MLEYEGQRATSVAETKVSHASNVGVLRTQNRIVVGLGQLDEFVVAFAVQVDWQVWWKGHAECRICFLRPIFWKLATIGELLEALLDPFGCGRRGYIVVDAQHPVIIEKFATV